MLRHFVHLGNMLRKVGDQKIALVLFFIPCVLLALSAVCFYFHHVTPF